MLEAGKTSHESFPSESPDSHTRWMGEWMCKDRRFRLGCFTHTQTHKRSKVVTRANVLDRAGASDWGAALGSRGEAHNMTLLAEAAEEVVTRDHV